MTEQEPDDVDVQEVAAVNAMWDQVEAAVARTGRPCRVLYSAYGMDGIMPVDNLNAIAYNGRCRFVQQYDQRWECDSAPAGCKSYISPVLTSPTWLEVAVLANTMMDVTGDYHHCFLEGIRETAISDGDVAVLEFCMGS